jgi:hypothetical protein
MGVMSMNSGFAERKKRSETADRNENKNRSTKIHAKSQTIAIPKNRPLISQCNRNALQRIKSKLDPKNKDKCKFLAWLDEIKNDTKHPIYTYISNETVELFFLYLNVYLISTTYNDPEFQNSALFDLTAFFNSVFLPHIDNQEIIDSFLKCVTSDTRCISDSKSVISKCESMTNNVETMNICFNICRQLTIYSRKFEQSITTHDLDEAIKILSSISRYLEENLSKLNTNLAISFECDPSVYDILFSKLSLDKLLGDTMRKGIHSAATSSYSVLCKKSNDLKQFARHVSLFFLQIKSAENVITKLNYNNTIKKTTYLGMQSHSDEMEAPMGPMLTDASVQLPQNNLRNFIDSYACQDREISNYIRGTHNINALIDANDLNDLINFVKGVANEEQKFSEGASRLLELLKKYNSVPKD